MNSVLDIVLAVLVAVLLLGLVLFLPVRLGAAGRAPVGPSPAEEREADG